MRYENVNLENLEGRLGTIIKSYSQEVQKEADDVLKKNAKAIVKDIKTTTAFQNGKGGKGRLKRSFVVTKITAPNGEKQYSINAKKNHKWSIVHLIEKGHKQLDKKGNYIGEVKARPFLAPLLATYSPVIEEQIKKIIKEAKGSS